MQQILPSMGQATVDVSIYQKLRDRFYEMLTDLGFEVVLPQGAFYLFPKSPEAMMWLSYAGLNRKGSSWCQGRVSAGLGISGSQSAAARRTSNDHDPVSRNLRTTMVSENETEENLVQA